MVRAAERGGGIAVAALLTVALLGCSLDTVIWGAEGAGVIETTERLIDAAAAGDADEFVCEGHDPEMREPANWDGLGAEEPEKFVAEYWPEQAALEPDWSINLSLAEKRATPGVEFPGDVFYRKTDGGLCLVDVAWWTVEG